MDAVELKMHTINEIEALPEGERAELIDGEIYMMAAPTRTHQRLLAGVYDIIKECVRAKDKGCEVYFAPFAVYLDKDEYTYLEPDLLVVCDKDKLDEKGCHGAPDFVVEIVSPSTEFRDYVIKLNKYASAGVKEYWIVDPDKKNTHVYSFLDGKFSLKDYDFDEPVTGELCPELKVVFAEIER